MLVPAKRALHGLAGCLAVLSGLALASSSDYTLLEQGWSDEEREMFWSLGQGAEIIPYSWFLALEQAGNSEKFNSPENIRRLGYIPWPENPQQLPIGFTRAANPHTGREWLGINCSACHTNTIEYAGQTLLVDGAPTLADYWQFNVDLVSALEATLKDDAKFERFATALEARSSSRQENALRDELGGGQGGLVRAHRHDPWREHPP